MYVAKLIWQALGIAALAAGVVMWLIMPLFQLSEYVQKFNYGSDWLIIFPIIAGLMTFGVALRWREQHWIHALGILVLASYALLLERLYVSVNAGHGLAAGLGAMLLTALTIWTVGSFLVTLALAVIAIGILEAWKQRAEIKKFVLWLGAD